MNETQKVLIVDDEPRNQRILEEVLDGVVGCTVASTGEEALALISGTPPDLVLLDIMMPGLDGYEVCRRIKANPALPFTKVILVSGKAMLEERLKGYEAGADDYMTKPFMPEELLAKVKVFLRLAKVEGELASLNQSLETKVEEKTGQLLDAEAKLVTSAKMAALGEMAGGIAHEINTPLGTIAIVIDQIAEYVEEEPIDKPAVIEMTKLISQTVQRIAAIIRGLRTFSRDGSQDRSDFTPLKQIIDETLTLCGEKMKHGSIQLRRGAIPDDLRILCRSVQISQVLLNLISNACDAVMALPERWVSIEAEVRDGAAFISVTDSGGGIPEKARGKIFQPFFTTKEIGKGTGLGLSVSKGILDAHNGSLTLDASCPNTRFVIMLPTAVSGTGKKAA